eukprot:TRINITY_DN6533_c1_g4_i2.p1 TRINITY_DN6533_c1_g4~~TRINITY_DN6533_c1_g4_i2.p1  ORF type:complete len:516 (+),score=184.07 TRINITY_DN6533_c1_g4_i2:162-1709(+)
MLRSSSDSSSQDIKTTDQLKQISRDTRSSSNFRNGLDAKISVELSDEQKLVMDLVSQGENIFYTGAAGTGKSFLLEQIIQRLKDEGKTVFVTASTGVAASNIGGMTLHSWSGIGLGELSPQRLYHRARNQYPQCEWWNSAEVLIIDEISMVSGELFDSLNGVAKLFRKNNLPFGGIQLILVGDFFQLPPVFSKKDQLENSTKFPDQVEKSRATFCFESEAWKECIRTVYQLSEVFRQDNADFVKILNQVRIGECTQETIKKLNWLSRTLPKDDIIPTKLFPFNKDVDQENLNALSELNTEEHGYQCEDFVYCQKLPYLQNCMAPAVLSLKVGAQVMLLRNIAMEMDLINGSRGVVIGFKKTADLFKLKVEPDNSETEASEGSQNSQKFRRKLQPSDSILSWLIDHPYLPLVRFEKGITCIVTPEMFSTEAKGELKAERLQLPVKLAWAITVHKCQGLTLDKVEMSLAKVFDPGQAYVALSRARSLEGLRIMNFNPNVIKASPTVIRWAKLMGFLK